ncbi:MAG: hypothetical protein VW405_01805 [Rhodospirillaceae bacterium]
MVSDSQMDAVQRQILGLYENLQKFKRELASVSHPDAEHDLIGTAADQLNAIAEETTDAADQIMAATEAIDRVNTELRAQIKFGGVRHHFEEIAVNVARIFEACGFHDITGQRLAKVVKTINAIEGALNSMVVIVDKDAIAALPTTDHGIHRDDDGIELAGPQSEGGGMNQDDIDKLFD